MQVMEVRTAGSKKQSLIMIKGWCWQGNGKKVLIIPQISFGIDQIITRFPQIINAADGDPSKR